MSTTGYLAVLVIIVTSSTPLAQAAGCYHRLRHGSVVYKSGEQETFNGFRCFYSNKLYWNRDKETLKANYRESTSVNLDQISKIDFDGDATDTGTRRGIRLGTVTFLKGEQLKNVYLYIGECEWARYESDSFNCDDFGKALIEGGFTDRNISGVVMTPARVSKAKPVSKTK